MNTRAYALAFTLTLSSPPLASAGDAWDRTDYALLGTAAAGIFIDWRQTQYIARHPESLHETNRILGTHPSVSQVNAYFARTSILSGAIAYWIPGEYRKLYLGTIAAIEVSAIAHNRSIGVKFQW